MGRPVLVAVVAMASGGCLLFAGCGGSASAVSQRAPALSARLILPTSTVRAGGQISGRITVQNDTGHAVRTSGCNSIFQVLLIGETYYPTPNWLDCLQEITIPRGRTSYPVQVEASYAVCSQGGPSAGFPQCTATGTPPLPPGDYEATTFESGDAIPVPAEVAVRVTEASVDTSETPGERLSGFQVGPTEGLSSADVPVDLQPSTLGNSGLPVARMEWPTPHNPGPTVSVPSGAIGVLLLANPSSAVAQFDYAVAVSKGSGCFGPGTPGAVTTQSSGIEKTYSSSSTLSVAPRSWREVTVGWPASAQSVSWTAYSVGVTADIEPQGTPVYSICQEYPLPPGGFHAS